MRRMEESEKIRRMGAKTMHTIGGSWKKER